MKISDLSTTEQTNEGFGDFINNYQANKQSAKSKQQNERAKAIGLKDFTYKLNSALQSALKGEIVALPNVSSTSGGSQPAASAGRIEPTLGGSSTAPASASASSTQPGAAAMNNMVSQLGAKPAGNTMANAPVSKTNVAKKPEPSMAELLRQRQQKGMTESQYKRFNKLVENKILNEAAESVSQFIIRFIDTQTRNLVDNPNYQQNINMIAKKLEDSYIKNKKLDSGLIEQAWETIWAWSQLGSNRGQSNRQQSVDMDNNGIDDTDQREQLKTNLIKILKNVDFNDPVKLKSIEPSIEGLLKMIQGIK